MFKTLITLGMLVVSQLVVAQDSQSNLDEPSAVTVAALADDCPPHKPNVGMESPTNPDQSKDSKGGKGKSAKNDGEVNRMPSQVEDIEDSVVLLAGIHNDPYGAPCR